MKVSILSYTGKGEGAMAAADLLIFTKNTRLTQSPDAFKEIQQWTIAKKTDELEYMVRSIPSSWEFVDATFLIEGVSRAFCQQFTRTRTNSYAMSSQRVVDQSGFEYYTGIDPDHDGYHAYHTVMDKIKGCYSALIELGVKTEDARGILPMNIHSNIIAKINLRTLSDMAKSRTGMRTQSEYRDVFDAIAKNVIAVWPWAELFLFPAGKNVAEPLERLISDACLSGLINKEHAMDAHKAIDLLKKGIR